MFSAFKYSPFSWYSYVCYGNAIFFTCACKWSRHSYSRWNTFKQRGQRKAISPECILFMCFFHVLLWSMDIEPIQTKHSYWRLLHLSWWTFISFASTNLLPHCSQANGSSFGCWFEWWSRSSFLLYALVQNWHLNGFSAEWTLKCLLKYDRFLNVFLQIEHAWWRNMQRCSCLVFFIFVCKATTTSLRTGERQFIRVLFRMPIEASLTDEFLWTIIATECRLRLNRRVKRAWHRSHLYVFSPVCAHMCCFRLKMYNVEKWLQMWHS